MTDSEDKAIETIITAIPQMSDYDRGYFVGFAEAMTRLKTA